MRSSNHPATSPWLRSLWQSGAIVLISVAAGLLANQLRSAPMPLVGDWSVKGQLSAAMKSTPVEEVIVTLDEARDLFLAQSAVFLDARHKESYLIGHIEGAKSLPWNDFDASFNEVMADIPKDTVLITYCDGEMCGLSKELAVALSEKGYTNVKVLLNGWTAWQEANLPVE
ncbi:MAG: rhodanese-like domain-containing protein [Acidobacteriota bacterium]